MTFEPWTCCCNWKNYRKMMASKIWSVYELHEDMERGPKERSCFSLEVAVVLLLSVSCHTWKENYESTNPRKRLFSISLFIRCQNIQELSRKWGLIKLPHSQAFLIMQITENLGTVCSPTSAFLLNVSNFTVQHSEVTRVVMCMPHCFQRCSKSSDICSFPSLAG